MSSTLSGGVTGADGHTRSRAGSSDEHATATMTKDGVVAWVGTRRGLLCLFGLGLGIRLVLAARSDGLWFDVTLFRQWSDRLVERGTAGFYEPGYFVDYPPGYLYVLLALGKVWRALAGGPPPIPVLKLPAIVVDLGVAAISALLAARLTPASTARRDFVRALAAAAILLNPALILVSAVWGQVDSFLAFLVLAGISMIATSPPSAQSEGIGIGLLAIAIATKPQAVMALPIVALVLARRHLLSGPSASFAWSTLLRRGVLLGGAAIGTVLVMFGPFGFSPSEIFQFYSNAGSVYPFSSLWAFNVWGGVGFYRPDIGAGALTVGGVPAFYVGLLAFAVFTLTLAARAWQSLALGVEANAVALFGAVAVTSAGFALLTRTHERYLYLAVAGLAPFVGLHQFRWALVILTLCFLLNLHFVYVFYAQHSSPPGDPWTIQPVYDLIFGGPKDAWQRKVLSVLTSTACLAVAWLGWLWLEEHAAALQVRARTPDAPHP